MPVFEKKKGTGKKKVKKKGVKLESPTFPVHLNTTNSNNTFEYTFYAASAGICSTLSLTYLRIVKYIMKLLYFI